MFRSNLPPSSLPEGWRPKQLHEIARVHGGGRLGLTKADYVAQGVPAYSAAGQDGYVDVVEGDEPSIILSSIGARCGKSFLAEGPWATLANTQVITPNQTVADARFLIGLLDDEGYWNRSGSAQPFIKPSDVKGAWVPLPPIDEQLRIAEVLQSVGDAIAAQCAVLEQQEFALKAARRSMVGLDGSKPEWPIKPILDCFQLQRGHDLPVQSRVDGDVPVIASNGPVGLHNAAAISGPGVITGRSGTIGKVSYFEGPSWPLNTTLFVKDFRGSSPRYIYHFLSAFPLKDYQSGTGVPTLNRNDVHVVEVPWPSVPEQEVVAEALDACESVAIEARSAIRSLTQLKSALLPDLLSGRVRVPA